MPDGTAELIEYEDMDAGQPGIGASWLHYPVQPDPEQAGEDAEPQLWNFDKLKHQVTAKVRPVLAEKLHAQYTASSKTYATIDEQLRRLHDMPQAAYAADDQSGDQQPPPAPPGWLAPGPYGVTPLTTGLLTAASSLVWATIRLALQIRWRTFFTRSRANMLYPAKHPDPNWRKVGRQLELVAVQTAHVPAGSSFKLTCTGHMGS